MPPGTQQLILIGRKLQTQYDFKPTTVDSTEAVAAAAAAAAAEATAMDLSTPITFTQETDYPLVWNNNSVKMTLRWKDTSVQAVAIHLRLRIPSWLPAQLPVALNGAAMATKGTPGSFLSIDRQWKNGDQLTFSLPTVFKLNQYLGVDDVIGYEGKRYALQLGPVVLACVAMPGVKMTHHSKVVNGSFIQPDPRKVSQISLLTL